MKSKLFALSAIFSTKDISAEAIFELDPVDEEEVKFLLQLNREILD